MLVFVGLLAVDAPPAHASCAALPPLPQALAEADVVFVGTVIETTNEQRWATVEVEEVWKGEDIPSTAEVRGGPKDPPGPMNVVSSVDTSYREGARYLFVPFNSTNPYRDNACTPTRRFTPEVQRLRPSHVAVLTPGDDRDGAPPAPGSKWPWIPVTAAALVLIAAGLLFSVLGRHRSGSGDH